MPGPTKMVRPHTLASAQPQKGRYKQFLLSFAAHHYSMSLYNSLSSLHF